MAITDVRRPASITDEARSSLLAWIAGAAAAIAVGAGIASSAEFGVMVLAAGSLAALLVHGRPRTDIEAFAGVVLLVSGLVGIPRAVTVGDVSLGGVLTIAYLIGAALLLVHDWGNISTGWPTLWPFAAFAAWAFASVVRVPPTTEGWQSLVVLAVFCAFAMIAAARARSMPHLPEVLTRYLERAFWVAAALYALSLARGGPGAKLIGTENNPRAFATFCLIALASALAAWKYGRRRASLVCGAAFVLIALSLSRLAFVTALVLIAFAWLRPRGIGGWLKLAGGACVAVALLAAAITFIPQLHARFVHDEDNVTLPIVHLEIDTQGRKQYWRAIWRDFRASPLVGHGAGRSIALITNRFDVEQPHNDYLRILDDFGLVGLALWVFALARVGVRILRAWRRADASSSPHAAFHLASLLILLGVVISMGGDNALVYVFIMAPLGLFIGCSIGVAAADDAKRAPRTRLPPPLARDRAGLPAA